MYIKKADDLNTETTSDSKMCFLNLLFNGFPLFE